MKLNDLVTLGRGHLSWFRYPTHNIGTYLGRGVSSILDVTEFFLIPARAKGLHKDQGDHNGLAQLTLSEILRVTVREAAAQYASHRHCRGQFPRDVVGVLILCFDSSYNGNQDVFSYHFQFRGECVSYEERT